MEHLFLGSTIISGLILFGVPGFSQDRDRDEDRYHNEDRGDAYWAGRLFDRVRVDLDHIRQERPYSAAMSLGLRKLNRNLANYSVALQPVDSTRIAIWTTLSVPFRGL